MASSVSPSTTDRIERQVLLKATRERVWRALSEAGEFGRWFGVAFDAGTVFSPGTTASGHITYPGYEHLRFNAHVERMDAPSRLSFRWHPYAIDPAVDYSAEPTTLVEFTLEGADGQVLLRVVESGFDAVPAARRELAFRMNSGGWDAQMVNIARHVDAA